MATITITANILDGNLGDGWRDNAAAADALAEYTKTVWENDLKAFADQGHRIEIDISVQYATTGFSGATRVSIDGEENESLSERNIELALTPDSAIWEIFCGSDIAQELSRD
jgi:hypothetical protein